MGIADQAVQLAGMYGIVLGITDKTPQDIVISSLEDLRMGLIQLGEAVHFGDLEAAEKLLREARRGQSDHGDVTR